MSAKTHSELLVHSATQLVTLRGGPRRGAELGRLEIIEDGALAIGGGEILAAGPTRQIRGAFQAAEEIDASGRAVVPGLVDAHTHPVWAGDRAAEFEQRIAGASYLEILGGGGGILSTVRATRLASERALFRDAQARLGRMAAHGTTTAEAKTGYGLDLETELKTLAVLRALDAEGPVAITPTFLGAHAVPEEASGPDEYVGQLVGEILPAVRRWWEQNAHGIGLPFVDAFCEAGAFDLGQTRRVLAAAAELGFPLKIHAEEFSRLGGARLAVELGAASADHLNRISEEDVEALGRSRTAAVLLPATPFGLGEGVYPPAQALIAANALIALGSDLNPGTAWCENLQFVIALACRTLRLTPAQALAAATINAAAAIQRQDRVGSLEAGKQADFVILDAPDYRHLAYRFGGNLAAAVYRRGRPI